MGQSKCKFCNQSIIWIECDGAKIPLDEKATTFMWNDKPEDLSLHNWVRSSARVVHTAVCKGQQPRRNPYGYPE